MKRHAMRLLVLGALVAFVCTAASQPPGGEPPGKKEGRGGPPRFELGRALPPGLREDLELTREQEKELAAIEKELKAKLEKLLTDEQKKKVQEFRPRFGPQKGGPGDGPPPKKDFDGPPKDGPPPKEKPEQVKADGGGIQWFGTMEAGFAEAQRTGKPILFVSAAPHCGGVPGMW